MNQLNKLMEDVHAKLLTRIPQIFADAVVRSDPSPASAIKSSSHARIADLPYLMEDYIYLSQEIIRMKEQLCYTRSDMAEMVDDLEITGRQIMIIDRRVSLYLLAKVDSVRQYRNRGGIM